MTLHATTILRLRSGVQWAACVDCPWHGPLVWDRVDAERRAARHVAETAR